MKTGITFFILLILALSPARGQSLSDRPDDFILRLAVVSPSSEIYMWWGHIALIVEDTRFNNSRLFNWGMFTYSGDSFIMDFLNGKVQYMCYSGFIDVEEFLSEGWGISVYNLDLDRKAKAAILSYAENSTLPENRYYDYGEFDDNCSTRIRDIIDIGTGGQFKAAIGGESGLYTLRQHIRRFTWSKPVADWVFNLAMGQNFDRTISPWEEMFLPVEIVRRITGFAYTDESGAERGLVGSVLVFNLPEESASMKKRYIPDKAPAAWPLSLLAGLCCAALLFLIDASRKKNHRLGRIFWCISQCLLGLCLGLLGCILFVGIFYMKNDLIKQNVNILFVNPLLLFIVPLGIIPATNRRIQRNADRVLRWLWTYVFIAGGITMLKFLQFFGQQNQSALALILPIAFVLSVLPEKIFNKIFSENI